MADYFRTATPENAVWALYFLTGHRPKRLVKRAILMEAVLEATGLPDWLFSECYSAVGDSAETIALVTHNLQTHNLEPKPLHQTVEEDINALRDLEDHEQKQRLIETWSRLDSPQRFVFNKLLTGGFRVGVSRLLVLRALSQALEVDQKILAHKLMGSWSPTPDFFKSLPDPSAAVNVGQPYPFCLAHPLQDQNDLTNPSDYIVEYKWDGIRAQLVKRKGQVFLWSRGEELINDTFPEIILAAANLPDGTVLDGEILAWQDNAPLPFGELQRRLGRKSPGKKLLQEVPVTLLCFDLLEIDHKDIRETPLETRAALLKENVPISKHLQLSRQLDLKNVNQMDDLRDSARETRAEGLMLKRKDSPYVGGRKTGIWWKYKLEPFTVDAVLIYAQRGSGKRASLYTDYTFGVWKDDELVPFAKAYSGLTDQEIQKVDNFIRRNTKERFGPVRTVTPELVFEIAFEGIRTSKRHKSGIAVRFPRISRWRTDKKPKDADKLENIQKLVAAQEGVDDE